MKLRYWIAIDLTVALLLVWFVTSVVSHAIASAVTLGLGAVR